MLLLDPADVPLHLAKMFKYVSDARESRDKKLAQRCTFCADRVFELFALVFLVTRIAMYPYVCWSAHVEATRYFPKGLPEWTCVALLWTLYGLQCYWFYLIIKVAVRMMATGRAEDVRSDDEDDDKDSEFRFGGGNLKTEGIEPAMIALRSPSFRGAHGLGPRAGRQDMASSRPLE